MCTDDLLNILIYAAIPLLAVLIMFFAKRKLLWVAPLISTALAGITYMMIFRLSGLEILDLFGNGEWRAFFLLTMLTQLVIAIGLTAAAWLAAYLLKRK